MALQPLERTTTHCQKVGTWRGGYKMTQECVVPPDVTCVEYFFILVIPHVILWVPSDVEFKEGEKEHFVEIEILYDGQREMREAFTVHMKSDENMVAEVQVRQWTTSTDIQFTQIVP